MTYDDQHTLEPTAEEMLEAQQRAEFEEAIFLKYYLSTVVRNPNPPMGTGALDFVSEGCETKAAFCARKGDFYVRDDVSAAWWGWKTALSHKKGGN